jgi:hypothetical protein
MEGMKQGGLHPAREGLERLMRGELPREEALGVVRHLLTGCCTCVEVTRRFWSYGDRRPRIVEETQDGATGQPKREHQGSRALWRCGVKP